MDKKTEYACKKLRDFRKSKGLLQREAAHLVCVHMRNYCRAEREGGERTARFYKTLRLFFEVCQDKEAALIHADNLGRELRNEFE